MNTAIANANDNANANPVYKNLELYIPRASLRTTEYQVKEFFFKYQIGIVEYCDLVVIKDKETKEPAYTSVFLKLDTWNPISTACADFEKDGSIKLFLSATEFWIILPNKNPLPRTHVNTSQLAASTEKLFEQSEKITEKVDKFEDEMRVEMAEMRMFMKMQQQSIEYLKAELDHAKTDLVQLRQDNSELTYQLKRSNNVIYGHNTIDEYEEAEEKKRQDKKLAEDKKLQDQFDVELDVILDLPLPPKLSRTASVAVYDYEDECIFSLNNRNERSNLSPIQAQSTSPTRSQTLVDIVLQNPEKAITSRDFCGNS